MRWILAMVVCAASLSAPSAHAATSIASCGTSTPRVSSGGIDDAMACVATFTTMISQQVTTRIEPGAIFAGYALLRVRGVNALWTQYEGYFVGGTLVLGQETSTFTLAPGTWQLEVYVGENAGTIFSAHRSGIGTFGGSVYA